MFRETQTAGGVLEAGVDSQSLLLGNRMGVGRKRGRVCLGPSTLLADPQVYCDVNK